MFTVMCNAGLSGVSNIDKGSQNNLTKTVIIICIGFVVCWSWNAWYYFAYNIGVSLPLSGPFYNFTVAMVSLHCCINPFTCTINCEEFRSAVHNITQKLRQRTAIARPIQHPWSRLKYNSPACNSHSLHFINSETDCVQPHSRFIWKIRLHSR